MSGTGHPGAQALLGIPMPSPSLNAVYGSMPTGLVDVPDMVIQVSPLIPGAGRLEDYPPESLASAILLAPPGTIERRFVLALALRALAPGGELTALAPKEKGGARLAKDLRDFGCAVVEEARRHHRICRVLRPEATTGLDAAIVEGAPRHVEALGLSSQPGLFSWNRLDPGSALLLQYLPALSGRGADFGCGYAALSRAVLKSPKVAGLTLIDNDRRAIEMARRNIEDARAAFLWADLRESITGLSRLDFVVTNPPFHDDGAEDRMLGKVFIARAAEALRPGGSLWLTANRHLPYETPLRDAFRSLTPVAEANGYKLFEARK